MTSRPPQKRLVCTHVREGSAPVCFCSAMAPEVLLPNSWEQSLSRPQKACRALCAPWFIL